MRSPVRHLLLLLLLFAPWLVHSEPTIYYIQSAKAKILEQPQFSSKLIAHAGKGDEVMLLATEGRWCRISLAGKIGWVSKFLIADHPPIDKVTVFEGSEGDDSLQENARRRASTVTTAGAARGLTAEDRARASHSALANYHAVDALDRFQYSEEEVLRFLEEGLKP